MKEKLKTIWITNTTEAQRKALDREAAKHGTNRSGLVKIWANKLIEAEATK